MSTITLKTLKNKATDLPKIKRNSTGKKNNIGGYIFILPLLIIFSVFLLFSFYFLLKNSFNSVTISFANPKFVGLANYIAVFSDSQFITSLINTFLLSSANIFAGLTFGFLISIFLGFKFRGKKFFQSIFFVPAMLPVSLIASVFGSMLEYKEGLINTMLRSVGLDGLALRWLTEPKLAVFSVMSVSIYLVGISIMYYTADLATLNTSVFEAATIDGAKMRQLIQFIIFPLMKNTHKTITLSLFLGGFREMERVFMMTNGGPGGATQIIGTYIYNGARSPGSNLGIVAAASVVVLAIAFVVSFIQLKLYEKGGK